ncbi:hypothetical protein GGI20_001987 [Coemansia sp. BCRC 34301]|nr:hypothetical protein GGI20_001987 [Coemansia sp. BCRC 34301]
MEVDLSPEEYFRHQAAVALLHSDEDAPDEAKETWSDIDDASGAEEEDPAVLKKKRYLRYGRNRLADMQERFNAGKTRLYDARQSRLDLEWAQLQDGTHPRYREFVDQMDARWSDRLAKIEQKMKSSCSFAETKLVSSQVAATNTFVAGRAELRRAMIYRRKKHMWALTDELRNLEKIREAIVNIACPPSLLSAPRLVKPSAASRRNSHHLLDVSGVPPPRAADDSDLSAIFSISSLLNHSDADILMPEDPAAAAVELSPALGDVAVPASSNEYAYHDSAKELAGLTAAERSEYYKYGDHGSVNGYSQQTAVPAATKAAAHYPSYYDASEPTGTFDYNAPSADPRYAGATVTTTVSSKISDLLHSSTDAYATYDPRHPSRQPPPAYYDSSYPHHHHHHHTSSASSAVATTALGKHELVGDYDDAFTKRQRMVPPSTTWPTTTAPYASHAHPQQQQQYATGITSRRSWNDLPSAAPSASTTNGADGYGGYYQNHTVTPTPAANHSSGMYQPQYHQQTASSSRDHHAHHYNQQQQQHYQQQHAYHHGHHHNPQQSASSASYYGAPPPPPPPSHSVANYDYTNDGTYYPRHQMSSASASTSAQQQHAPAHYHGNDTAYYHSASAHYQQGTSTAAVAPGGGRASDPYYAHNQAAAWNDNRYPQQVGTAGAPPSMSTQQHGYDRNGYYKIV